MYILEVWTLIANLVEYFIAWAGGYSMDYMNNLVQLCSILDNIEGMIN